VKEFLSQKGVTVREKNIEYDRAAAQEVMDKTGQMAVPVTVIGGETIVGFDRAQLEAVLARAQTGRRPSLGAAVADAAKITAVHGAGVILGAYVGKVKAGSVAEKIGLIQGDIITELNMQNIANAAALELALSKLRKGSRISVIFLRGSDKLSREGLFS
jgi:glutaredoxin